jgi:VanZ family protein
LKTVHQGFVYWLPVASYAALIFYLSSLSHPETYVPSLLLELGDKTLHGLEYAVLGIFCFRAFRHGANMWAASHAVLLAIITSTGYGLTDEIHQAFVPFREADVWDLVTDALGAAVGVSGWHWLRSTQRKTSQHSGFSELEKRV